MAALNAMGIRKRFGGQLVLDDAWIDVPENRIVGLIGPNGAGKSTFLTVLSKFARPDAGVITSRNMDVTRRSPHALARAGIVRTFQVPHEFGELTVLQNMLVAAKGQAGEHIWQALLRPRHLRAQDASIRARGEEWLRFLGLAQVADRAAKSLSGGQKKLLELGRALMTDPYLLLLDEPFAGVAPGLVDVIIEKILELRTRKLGFLIVEHNMDAVNALCDRVFVMERGRILTDGSPQTIADDPRVLKAYLGGEG